MRQFFVAAIAALAFAGCQSGKETSVVGSWIEPIPGMEGVQGMTLNADGSASSINMYTLLYDSWQQQGDSLSLAGKSVSNGQTIEFTEKFKVTLLSSDSLVLTSENIVMKYGRQKHYNGSK